MEKPMKYIVRIIIICCFLLSIESVVLASDDTLMPTYTYIDASDPVREYMSQAELYVSREEVWFSGTTEENDVWIVKTNAQGSILEQYMIPFESYDVTVLNINKGENGLLIGVRDAKTLMGCVGLLTDDGDITYTQLGDFKVFSCAPAKGGLLVLGIIIKENQTLCAPYIVFVDQNGQIAFEKTGEFGTSEEDMAHLSSSCCCASDDAIYVVEARGIPSSILATRELISMDFTGREKWRISLQDDVVPYAISASDSSIYLYGTSVLWDEIGRILDQKGLVQCYSKEGVCQWTQQVAAPTTFQQGNDGWGACAAAGKENETCYFYSFAADGTILGTTALDGAEQSFHELYILSNGTIQWLGEGKECLIICDVPF